MRSGSKLNRDGCALSWCTVQGNFCVVISNCVLDDGQTQAGAASCFGVALVHPVEPLEDPVLMLCRDTNAGIAYREIPVFHMDLHMTTGNIVLDGIVAEVV